MARMTASEVGELKALMTFAKKSKQPLKLSPTVATMTLKVIEEVEDARASEQVGDSE
ncbi:hypothetical protein ACSHWG_01105 [Leucobacter sp. Z1108]|uniref:hypothetical protein n=1 Tax=Leucobacter sp. Z1108 TaxID=3439066 RepID=UPI003F2A7C65